MATLEIIENALKTNGVIKYDKVVISDNLSVHRSGFKGQEIIFAVHPIGGIYDISGLNTFLTNIFNIIGIKENYDFYECKETNEILILGRINYVEAIAWLTQGDFANIILKPGINIEVDKKELSAITSKPIQELKRFISVILFPDKKVLDYALRKHLLQIGASANIPEAEVDGWMK